MGIGTNIKRLLSVKKMTIKELAEKTGIPVNTLYSITRRDSHSTKTEYLGKISAALDVGVDQLVDISKVSSVHGGGVFWSQNGEVLDCTGKLTTPKDIADIASTLSQEGMDRLLSYALELAELEHLKSLLESNE